LVLEGFLLAHFVYEDLHLELVEVWGFLGKKFNELGFYCKVLVFSDLSLFLFFEVFLLLLLFGFGNSLVHFVKVFHN
jgi:hypothetical protein